VVQVCRTATRHHGRHLEVERSYDRLGQTSPDFSLRPSVGVPQCMAGDHDWAVLTLARNGTWGIGTDSTQSQAIDDPHVALSLRDASMRCQEF
jgi:hypothetical protein